MNPYLIKTESIAALAAFAARNRNLDSVVPPFVEDNPVFSAVRLATHLTDANIKSVLVNNPSALYNNIERIELAVLQTELYFYNPVTKLEPLDYYRIAENCLLQSCLAPGFAGSAVQQQLERIKSVAVSLLPGYGAAVEEYNPRYEAGK